MLFPSDRVTITNQTSIYNIRMVGDSYYTQLTNGVPITPFTAFTYLGIRTVSNSTDMDIRLARWFGVRAGYQYSNRRIGSKEAFAGAQEPVIAQTNGLHTGLLGFRIRPVQAFTIRVDGEIGRADRPIYPVSQRNFHAVRGRAEYRTGPLRIAAIARLDYNINSESLANFASRSRQYGGDFTWTIRQGLFIDASYAKFHLDTLGALRYFARSGTTNQEITGDRSYYVSNLHSANVAARFSAGRADISLGLSHVQDVGDDRAVPASGEPVASLPAFIAAQTFPLRYTSPQGRVSIRINENLRWNAGYQHYGYSEEFSAVQNFRAHTGYSSISWSF
jgi:hypothetical protein